MSRVWQMERLCQREEESLARDLSEGRISQTQYNTEMQNIQRELRAAYAADREDALRAVEDEWGY